MKRIVNSVMADGVGEYVSAMHLEIGSAYCADGYDQQTIQCLWRKSRVRW
jgi:hypothetical protein